MNLKQRIAAAAPVRDAQDAELKTALAFAALEISELKAGIRTLTQCPGIEQVAERIRKAKASQ